jgi:ribosome-binding factor A
LRAEKPYKRTERIEHQLLEILGEINVRHIDLSQLGFITFTTAKITPDLRQAKIYYSVLKPRIDIEEITNELNLKKGLFRKFLAPELHIKNIPELTFYYDEINEYSEKIDRIFNAIQQDPDDL